MSNVAGTFHVPWALAEIPEFLGNGNRRVAATLTFVTCVMSEIVALGSSPQFLSARDKVMLARCLVRLGGSDLEGVTWRELLGGNCSEG